MLHMNTAAPQSFMDTPVGVPVDSRDLQGWVKLINYVRDWGKPNVYGARVPIRTPWNLKLMEQLAGSVADREVVQFMTYGWPLNHDGRQVSVTLHSHVSACWYLEAMDQYFMKKQKLGCLLGPFASLPWMTLVAVSPMSTRPKKESQAWRVIMDLSWPHNGATVNDGISKEKYVEQTIQLQYPTVDCLCQRAAELRTSGVMGYKIDMDRAFKQIFMDIADWLLLGVTWRKVIFFDKTAVMGSRSAPYICQHVTNFIRHVMAQLDYFVANYVDDFMGLDTPQKIWASFQMLHNLLRDLGASEAVQKAVLPTYVLEFLGVLFDLWNMTISVTPEQMKELRVELKQWAARSKFTRKQLESQLGKLQFVSNCVGPGRLLE